MIWEYRTIGDVLSIIQNGVNCKQNKNCHGNKITRIETISESRINYSKTGFAVLDEKQKIKAELKKGDILFSHINSPSHVGKTAIYMGEEELYHGINLLRLNTIKEVDNFYFNYFLRYLFWDGYWNRNSKQSINQASVNQEDIKSVPFSFPILSEQKRIVTKLDSIFNEIDKSQKIKTLKLISLKNLEDKIICDVFKDYSNMVSISEVTDKTNNLNIITKFPKKSFQYIDVSSINKETLKISKTQKILGLQAPSRARREIRYGDLIYATIRPTLKRIAIVPKELDGQICSTGFVVLRGKKNILDNKYLFYILSSSIATKYMKKSQTGASYPAVTDKQVKKFKIPLPSYENQKIITEKLENIITEIQKARIYISDLLDRYYSLKIVILKNTILKNKL